MCAAINITPEEIAFAERVLLPEGKTFDDERRNYITNLDTIDLQAVPGSGKTTALLAKLLILEKHLPFEDGSGILVISHTNAAIDEIKDRIGKHCPRLFSYPNFIGTIQSFVDTFLAIPFGHNQLKTRISWIDVTRYKEALWSEFNKIYWDSTYDQPGKYLFTRHIKRATAEANTKGVTPKVRCNELIQEEVQGLYFDFRDKRIKHFRDDSTFLANENNAKYQGIKQAILNVIGSGVISYQYAYKMGFAYCECYPEVANFLKKRFRFVFVDEMQDMDEDQYNLLEQIFYDNEGTTKFQRIGDKNQAIYNGIAKFQDIWQNRDTVLPLNGSHRLTPPVAELVNCFALERQEGFEVNGLGEGNIKPHLIVYENATLGQVVPKYAEVIIGLQGTDQIPKDPKHPFKVVAWNTDWEEQHDIDNPDKLRLIDFHKSFKRDISRPKNDYDALESYLKYYNKEKKTLEPIRKNILNALLKVLRLEDVRDENDRPYSKRKLLNFLKYLDDSGTAYQSMKQHLYNWSMGVIKGNEATVLQEIRDYIPEFLNIFGKTITNSTYFINNSDVPENVATKQQQELSNQFEYNGISLEIGTVHSSKGQTHTATLYLETFYQGKYESEYLAGQLKGTEFNDGRQYHKQANVMAYVGLSRPNLLLCMAVHKSRFDAQLADLDKDKWVIIELFEE